MKHKTGRSKVPKWFDPLRIEQVFGNIYDTLAYASDDDEVRVTGSRLSFDYRKFNFDLYGSFDGRQFHKHFSGDTRNILPPEICCALMESDWQEYLIPSARFKGEFDK